MVFYLVKRGKACFLLDVLFQTFPSVGKGVWKLAWRNISWSKQGRQVTSGTWSVTFPLSSVFYFSTFPITGRLCTRLIVFWTGPMTGAQEHAALVGPDCGSLQCHLWRWHFPWRTFSTVLGFPVFSLFLMLLPLLTQSIILGRCVLSLPFPFSGKYNTFAFLLSPVSGMLKKVSEMFANPGKTTNCSRCQKWKQLDHHLEMIAIVSQQHKSITYNGHSMTEANYVFPILKYQFLNCR